MISGFAASRVQSEAYINCRRRERVSVRKRDKDRGRHIWIVDPTYSRLRRSVIGLPCKIGLKKNGVKYLSDQEQYLKHHI